MMLDWVLAPRRHRYGMVLLTAVGGAGLLACRAPPANETPSEQARVLAPSDLLPSDLDFVVRIDAARVRNSPVLAGVVRDLAKSSAKAVPGPALAALENARAIFVGGRLMSDGFHGDGVVAIEGLPPLDSGSANAEADFRRTLAKVPDMNIFERTSVRRDEAVLMVVLPTRGTVFATAAEADAVLRVISAGPDRERLDPPAHGLASFAGRRAATLLPLARKMAPTLSDLGEGLTSYAGTIDADDALTVEVWLEYISAKHASRASQLGRRSLERLQALGPPVGTVADSTTLTESGGSVRVRATVPFATLTGLH